MIRTLKRLFSPRNPIRLLWHRAKAFCAALLYGFPARRLTIVGITGTDGKTTTVGMTAHILHEAGFGVGALSTAFFRVRDSIEWNATQKTSPSPFIVQRFLRRLVREGCTHAVLEYSSHGLVQGRTLFTWPRVAAITNTSLEHLDYHGTMERYRADKGMLFAMLDGKGAKVLHRDDETFALYRGIPSARTISYGAQGPANAADRDDGLWLSDIREQPDSSSASLHHTDPSQEERTVPLTLSIPGTFNLENALCALGCAAALGIPVEKAAASLTSFHGVPGRMERIAGPQSFAVYVDFTVTPLSYRKTLSALRRTLRPGKRLLVLTGSCGDRMREKRPEVGKICGELADVVVVTNEDPYTEDPDRIIDEVWAGIDKTKAAAFKIRDRLEAIIFLFSQATEGDAVLLCGKGSDTTMWVKGGQIPWNEREIAKSLLEKK